MNYEHALIAILVHRLGGDVTVTEAEIASADFDMETAQVPTEFAWRMRVRPRPFVVAGEVVREAARAIEARADTASGKLES